MSSTRARPSTSSLAALARWVKPANKVFRLTDAATDRLLAQPPTIPFPAHGRDDFESVRKIWGLYHLFPRAAFEAIGGYDPRFRGWGGEDTAAIAAMDTLWGEHTMLVHPLYHLHHPMKLNTEGEAIWGGQAARNTDLRDRYDAARGKPELMRDPRRGDSRSAPGGPGLDLGRPWDAARSPVTC